MKIVCISDTHEMHGELKVPDGDILIHAGDFTGRGEARAIRKFDDWLGTLPHIHKIIIAGNHDFLFESDPKRARALLTNCTYLEDDETDVEGLRIYGSPWQPWFYDWAFNLQRGAEIKRKWDKIPIGIDILITHGPPAGYGDECERGERVGCIELLTAIKRTKPKYHIFGHIHENPGVWTNSGTTFINASSCNLNYRIAHEPVVLDV